MFTKKISIQVVSDLHLEYVKKMPTLKIAAPNIALLGDIGNPRLHSYKKFLDTLCKNYDNVFLISGNHEYWNICSEKNKIWTKQNTDIQIENIVSKHNNIHYLNNKSIEINGVKIIGSTLWSYINIENKYIHIGDYNMISYNLANDMRRNNKMFFENMKYLEENIKTCKIPVIVMTHHLPSFDLISDKYKDNKYNFAYASNIKHIMEDPIKIWLSGHTHKYIDKRINGIRCCVNPHGYSVESTGFVCDKVIDLEY